MWLQRLNKRNDSAPRRAAAHAPDAAPLSLAALERIAPSGHLKSTYPPIWERIWLFCHDPAHLEKYLASLAIQERDGKRAGLSAEAMAEVASIRAANQPLLGASTSGKGWEAAWLLR
ncbi:MAG TPA: hypothetical protein VFS02_14120 [Telluria sp.]|nr:hypothetical protein [Telluria sp.]